MFHIRSCNNSITCHCNDNKFDTLVLALLPKQNGIYYCSTSHPHPIPNPSHSHIPPNTCLPPAYPPTHLHGILGHVSDVHIPLWFDERLHYVLGATAHRHHHLMLLSLTVQTFLLQGFKDSFAGIKPFHTLRKQTSH